MRSKVRSGRFSQWSKVHFGNFFVASSSQTGKILSLKVINSLSMLKIQTNPFLPVRWKRQSVNKRKNE